MQMLSCDCIRSRKSRYTFPKCSLGGRIITIESPIARSFWFIWILCCFLQIFTHLSWSCPVVPHIRFSVAFVGQLLNHRRSFFVSPHTVYSSHEQVFSGQVFPAPSAILDTTTSFMSPASVLLIFLGLDPTLVLQPSSRVGHVCPALPFLASPPTRGIRSHPCGMTWTTVFCGASKASLTSQWLRK